MSLIASSYEKFIWGYKLRQPNPTSSDQTLTPNPQFSYAAHLSPIKFVPVSGIVAASSAGDDTVKLYDLSTSSELDSLLLETSVTSLSFFTPPLSSFPRNLFVAADDGSFSIFDVDPFVLLKTIQVHKKGINHLCVHPSGKLALTVGRDSCLAMVNFVRGRRSFICRLKKEANIVEYCSGGGKFFMAYHEKIMIHDAMMG
ncbi:p21-activated protein kinase-interacting protein 1-like [Chenopodium quinoa]|uniref:p21-activated protein kinase-interacting protein 1-like n=1 Tax=Chenopodium quinoa TaxID=63459 RepID=UPI000B78D60E|nr:p21-activated protein kinase-interacting protein 1-like [Chenopodium quinoa]